jgi:lactoylglutathione lyase
MRTLHFSLRVADPDRSLAFYRVLGYEVVGRVADSPEGDLTMIKLPDDEFVTIELVHDPAHRDPGSRSALNHFVIAVESMESTVAALATDGIDAETTTSPDGRLDFLTTWIVDPDGNRIELVQWPLGHTVGMSAADWPDRPEDRSTT